MSSLSERLSRGGAVALFAAALAGSAVAYKAGLPVFGAPLTHAWLSGPVVRATALLSAAKRPYTQATLCEPLKAYVPDLVESGRGGHRLPDDAPVRPVILCALGAEDLGPAISRARRDGLVWTRRIAGTPIIAFAADEARFRAALGASGVTVPASDLKPFSPLIHALRSNARGVVEDGEAWLVPAHADDGLILFGPYLDLEEGAYRLRLHMRLQGSPAQCRDAATHYSPTFAVTRNTGTASVQARGPAAASADRGDPCSLAVEGAFAVAPGGARTVETPFYGAMPLPMAVDGYALEPAAPAPSR